jgi:hypothetical protein
VPYFSLIIAGKMSIELVTLLTLKIADRSESKRQAKLCVKKNQNF